MLVFFSKLLGEDPARTVRYHAGGRRRIQMLGTALLVPILLWFVSTWLLVADVMDKPWYIALPAALIAATLILLIERAIVMAPGKSWWLLGFRLGLGFLIAILGSLCIDEVVFKADIDQKVAVLGLAASDHAAQEHQAAMAPGIQRQEAIVHQAYLDWQHLLEEARREADGTGGSGRARVGKIARLKLQQADKLETRYLHEKQELASMKQQVRQEALAAGASVAGHFNPHGLLIRIKALFELVWENNIVLGCYLLFTLLLFCLEFMVILLKVTTPLSTDEQLESEAEALILHRARRTAGRARTYGSGVEGLPVYRDARLFANSKLPGVF